MIQKTLFLSSFILSISNLGSLTFCSALICKHQSEENLETCSFWKLEKSLGICPWRWEGSVWNLAPSCYMKWLHSLCPAVCTDDAVMVSNAAELCCLVLEFDAYDHVWGTYRSYHCRAEGRHVNYSLAASTWAVSRWINCSSTRMCWQPWNPLLSDAASSAYIYLDFAIQA